MADEARTIRVSGLPLNISENRLVDKLQIHFLRKKNDGGDISSIVVSKTLPGTAFITFEERQVASRLAQRGKQAFKVSDKTYDISISLHQEAVDVDKVLLSMSVVVDYKKLPGGKNTLLSLHKSFPGVSLVFDDQKERYVVKGGYSEVQLLTSLLVESLDQLQSQNLSSGRQPSPKTESIKAYCSLLEKSPNSHFGVNEDAGVVKHTGLSDVSYQDQETGLPLPGGHNDVASHAALTEDKWVPASDIGAGFEDFSLIVDSDIFRYIHKYCSNEYQGILRRHDVEVLDVNCDDITNLYLKSRADLFEPDIRSIKKAHRDLAHLYQQKESQLRREHIYKHGVPEKKLTSALELLRTRLPKLMIDEEDRNVYMVGSISDVSEAKQFLSDVRGAETEKKIQSDHLFVPSQSKSTIPKQESSASSGPSGIFLTSRQDPDDLFMPKGDTQDARRGQTSVELESFDDRSPTGQFTFSSQRLEKSKEDIFSQRRNDVSQERHDLEWMDHGGLVDKNKCTDHLADFSKPSAPQLVLNTNETLFNKSDLHSGSETQITSSKGSRTKQPEASKERKMAANFNRETYSSLKDLTSHKQDVPKRDEDADVKENMFPDSKQPLSLPLILPSGNSNLDLKVLRGGSNATISTSKMDFQNRKPTLTSASFSGDQEAKSLSILPSTLRTSDSQSSQTRETVAMDITLPYRLWLYLTSVYKTEIEHLTSDLQVKELLDKEGITLSLRGVDSGKVSECHQSLKRLIAAAEMDFDIRTLQLSRLGVSNSKDETLLGLCKFLKGQYRMVKILVMSKDVMILGPKESCDEVEATMINAFHKDGMLEKPPFQDTSFTSKAPDNDLKLLGDTSKTSTKPHTDIITKDLSKISDQGVSCSSEEVAQVLTNQTRDNRKPDNQSASQTITKTEKLEQLDKKDSILMHDDASHGSVIISATKAKADGADDEKSTAHTGSTAQSKETSSQQMNPGSSVDQTSPRVPEPNNVTLTSHASRNQNLLSCCVCKNESSTVKQAACGYNFCPKCEKEVHITCRSCTTSGSGIKGTMSVQESTVTIPGFNKDTTLKIVYDIPDGVQREDHPCPGAPFRGNRFEAFLPRNKATEKLLPLLEKAFHKGLTFTVKAGSSDDDGDKEGTVVWGSIPHKTKTEGGASKNGYPDFTYIRRLEEALKAAGVEE